MHINEKYRIFVFYFNNMDDEKIIELCKLNSRKGQHALHEKYYGKLMPITYRYFKSMAMAKDVLQDVFLKIFDKIHTYNNDGSFEGWLKRITLNHSIDLIRKKPNEYLTIELFGENIPDNYEEETEIEWSRSCKANKILDIIQGLSPQYRAVFNMYAIDGFSHKEIAEELNISVGASKSNYAKAKKNIIKKLNKI